MKSYTDIEQSKKLSAILSPESADMVWANANDVIVVPYDLATRENVLHDFIPCWSLAALLKVIPKHFKYYNVLRIDISENEFAIWYDEIAYGVNNDLPDITNESAIDACVEMILQLSEMKLL